MERTMLGNKVIETVINNRADVNAEDRKALKYTPFSNSLLVLMMVKIVSKGTINSKGCDLNFSAVCGK